jgi:Type II secretory pathway, component HofQ
MSLLRSFVAGAWLMVMPSAAANVRSLSVVPGAGRAEVVIGVDAAVQVQDFTLSSPNRVVVDLKGATLAMPGSSYDRIARGGITNVRYSQFRANVVRVVIELDGAHPYDVRRSDSEVRVSVSGSSASFAAWSSGATAATDASTLASESRTAPGTSTTDATSTTTSDDPPPLPLTPAHQPSQQPPINVNFQDTDIRDVIAAFATFSGRTIVVGKDVTGTVTAEIRNQPWDVALRAILDGTGPRGLGRSGLGNHLR